MRDRFMSSSGAARARHFRFIGTATTHRDGLA